MGLMILTWFSIYAYECMMLKTVTNEWSLVCILYIFCYMLHGFVVLCVTFW